MMQDIGPKDYIFAQGQDRELATIVRLICDPIGGTRPLFGQELNWSMPYVWFGVRIPQRRLVSSDNSLIGEFDGDVDVCGGSLQPVSQQAYDECYREMTEQLQHDIANLPDEIRKKTRSLEPNPLTVHNLTSMRLLELRKIKWPPQLSSISALEVKVGWYSAENDLKAMGSTRKGRHQALALCRMGFDRVALARFIVTEPVVSDIHHPWMLAGERSGDAGKEYSTDSTRGQLIREDDPFGTVLIEMGSVPGKLEHMAGSMGWKWLHPVTQTPVKEATRDIRRAVEKTLNEAMSRYPTPGSVPALLLSCSNDQCDQLYVSSTDAAQPCEECGSAPRSAFSNSN